MVKKTKGYHPQEHQSPGMVNSAYEKDPHVQVTDTECKKKKENGPSFWKTIVASIGPFFMMGGLYKLVYDVVSFINPQILE